MNPALAAPSPGWRALAPFALAPALALLAALRTPPPGAEDAPWLGALIVFAGLLPLLRWRRTRSNGGVPFVGVVCALYALAFGLPVLLTDDPTPDKLRAGPESLERALLLSLAGIAALLVGFRGARPCVARLRPLSLPLDPQRVRRAVPWLLGAGAAATLLLRTTDVPAPLVQPARLVEALFLLGLGLLALRSFRGELGARGQLLFWGGLVPAWLFVQVGIGSVAQLAYAAAFLVLLAWGAGRRVPVAALLALGGALVLFRGHVEAFRSQTWDARSARADAGPLERSWLFLDLVVERTLAGGGEGAAEAARRVAARVDHVSTFAHVVELTPGAVPHWRGGSYAALPTTLVPRLLWPDKPTKEVGQAFGHRYRLLDRGDRTTAINLPQVVELYANFGATGVLFGMLALGALYRLLERWWNAPGVPDGTLLLACVLYSRLILIESDFSLVFGGVLQRTLLLALVLHALRPPRLAPAPRLPRALEQGSTA